MHYCYQLFEIRANFVYVLFELVILSSILLLFFSVLLLVVFRLVPFHISSLNLLYV